MRTPLCCATLTSFSCVMMDSLSTPSVTTTRTFLSRWAFSFRWSMDMRMASRMAVPPRESMRVRASSIFRISLVKFWPSGRSRKASSLKLTTKTSSSGLESFTRASEAASTPARLIRMLPLLSITRPSETGTSSRRKLEMRCAAPFSAIAKASRVRSVTRCPLLSKTVVLQITTRVSARKTGACSGNGAGFACWPWSAQPVSRIAPAIPAANPLFIRRMIAHPPESPQQRHPGRLHQLDLHMAVFSVALLVGRGIAKHVLIPQLHSDFGGDIRQLIGVFDLVLAATGLVGHFAQQRGAVALLRGPAARTHGFVDSDGIDLDVGFFYQVTEFPFGVAAAVVAAIGDDQNRLAPVPGPFHFMQAQVDCVQQGGHAFGLGETEAAPDLPGAAGEGLHQVGRIVELHQEELVFGIGGLQELGDSLAGLGELLAHAARTIEQNANGKGGVFAGKLRNDLRLLVLKDLEILLFEACDKAVQGIGDGDRNEDDVDVRTDVAFGQDLLFGCGLGARGDGNLRIASALIPTPKGAGHTDGADQKPLMAGRQHHVVPAFLASSLA